MHLIIRVLPLMSFNIAWKTLKISVYFISVVILIKINYTGRSKDEVMNIVSKKLFKQIHIYIAKIAYILL